MNIVQFKSCYSWLYIGSKQQVAKGNQSKSGAHYPCQNPVFLSHLQHFSQYPCSTQQCYILDENNNDIDTSTPCCFKLPFSLNGTISDSPTTTGNNDSCPYCPDFLEFPGKILMLFKLLFFLNCSFPTIFWNCHTYHLAMFLALINNH